MGSLLHYTDENNWYGAFIDGSKLLIKKKANGIVTTISSTPFSATANTLYSLRFQVVGNSLSAKVWQTSKNEPLTWTATVTDSSFASGMCGLQFTESSTSATVTSFTVSIF
jgi:hypothetical protein